jgi:hypothetical protein
VAEPLSSVEKPARRITFTKQLSPELRAACGYPNVVIGVTPSRNEIGVTTATVKLSLKIGSACDESR